MTPSTAWRLDGDARGDGAAAEHDDRDRLRGRVAALEREKYERELFLGSLAHDLRGPLGVAAGFAHLLARGGATSDGGKDHARRIERILGRADRMLLDLLDAARLGADGWLPIVVAPCELGALARDVREDLVALHGDRFHVAADEEVCGHWSGDALRRALWNLGTNAAKYGARDRDVAIEVRRDGSTATLAVRNFGGPIDARERPRLFEPFVRGSAARAAREPGWGLGLTLVRACADAHGGSVTVESDRRRGTAFTVRLPLDARPFAGSR